MDLVEVFLKHAEDCHSMARRAGDTAAKASWQNLAQRWERCATAQSAMSQGVLNSGVAKRRPKAKVWS